VGDGDSSGAHLRARGRKACGNETRCVLLTVQLRRGGIAVRGEVCWVLRRFSQSQGRPATLKTNEASATEGGTFVTTISCPDPPPPSPHRHAQELSSLLVHPARRPAVRPKVCEPEMGVARGLRELGREAGRLLGR
jgi:hypothetical protein